MAHPAGGNTQHHCKDCNIFFDSSKSLDVHLQYHQENPLSKWGQPASGASSSHGEDNNNFIKPGAKRGQGQGQGDYRAVTAPADSSDMQAFQGQNYQPFSPPFGFNNRTRSPTPNGMTNQGFNSNSQPDFSMRPPSESSSVKQESGSFNYSSPDQQHPGEQNGPSYILGPGDEFPVMPGSSARPPSTPNSAPPPSPQSTQMQIPTSTPSYRFHPYGGHPGMSQQYAPSDRNVVSSSSPVPRPSPAPSPQHCEKCGVLCPSQESLREHQALVHQPPHQQAPPGFQQFASFRPPLKTEDEESSILDLDSQKINNAFQAQQQQQEEERRRQQMGQAGQHSVSALLNWVDNNAPPGAGPGPGTPPGMQQPSAPPAPSQQMWQRNGMQGPGPGPGSLPLPLPVNGPGPMSMPGAGGMIGPPGFNPSHGMQVPQPQYQHRPYLSSDGGVNGGPGMPQQLITSSQAPNPMSPGLEPTVTKGMSGKNNASWKSNEARRPKTYHCSACNKWFTSSGHLKRHYNTTLHKNAVKQSGAPDPATLPVSSHHHPERDPKHANGINKRATPVNLDSSASPAPSSGGGEESSPSDDAGHSNGFGRTTPVQGMPGVPPSSQPPPQPLQHMPPPPHQLTASPPNRLAGPSEMTPGGLLPMSSYHELGVPPNTSALQAPAQHSPTQHPFLGVGLHPSLPPPHPIHQPAVLHHHFQPIPPTSMGPSPVAHPPPSSMGGLHSTMTAYPNGLPPHDSITTTLYTSHHPQHLTSSSGSLSLEPTSDARGNILPSMSNFVQYGVDPYGGYVVSASQNVGGPSPAAMTPMAADSHMNQPPSASGTARNNAVGLKIQNTFSLAPAFHPPGPPGPPGTASVPVPVPVPVPEPEPDVKPRPGSPPDFPTSTSTDDIMREKERLKMMEERAGRRSRRKRPRSDETHSNVISSSTGGKSSPEGVTNMSGGLVFNSSMISEGGIHKCLDCDKQFNKACYLTQHNKSFHAGDKPYKCDRCGKRFPSDYLYKEHLGKHAGDKPYKCEMCPKQFNHKTDLRRHLCLHSGEKPYACDVCGKGFIRKDHMLKHCETHRRKQPPHLLPPHQIST